MHQLPRVSVPESLHKPFMATLEVKPAQHTAHAPRGSISKGPLLCHTKQTASLLLPNHRQLKDTVSSTFPSRLSPFSKQEISHPWGYQSPKGIASRSREHWRVRRGNCHSSESPQHQGHGRCVPSWSVFSLLMLPPLASVRRLTEHRCHIFCLALLFTVCSLPFLLVIKTAMQNPIKYHHKGFFGLSQGWDRARRVPAVQSARARGMREGREVRHYQCHGRPTWEQKGSVVCSKQIGQEKSRMERKESFSTCSAQQTPSLKNLLAIHYAGFAAKAFALSRDIQPPPCVDVTCATEVQSSLLIHAGMWTACHGSALSQSGNASCRGDAGKATLKANNAAGILNKG